MTGTYIKKIDLTAVTDSSPLNAGHFSGWLEHARANHSHNTDNNVPCGSCNACCKSSYFIHIAPTETETLRSIPKELLFPAPAHPEGHLLLGYDTHGQCPLLVDERCSIYAQRPQTCRTFDCRIFAAAGIAAGDEDKAGINRQLTRWSFTYADPQDNRQHTAVRSAAEFLQAHTDDFPVGFVPSNNTQLAVLALRVYSEFADYDAKEATDPTQTSRLIAAVVAADAAFERTRECASP